MDKEFIRFILAIPNLYRRDDIWHQIVKERFPNVEKNSFQSWKNFYFFLNHCVTLLQKNFNYIYSQYDIKNPDTLYNEMKYNISETENLSIKYFQYTCQHNTC
jgi:hypothetical protein